MHFCIKFAMKRIVFMLFELCLLFVIMLCATRGIVLILCAIKGIEMFSASDMSL